MWLGLALVVVLIGVGYYWSLKLNPWVMCSKCHGTPRLKGLVFKHVQRVCPRCAGTGRFDWPPVIWHGTASLVGAVYYSSTVLRRVGLRSFANV